MKRSEGRRGAGGGHAEWRGKQKQRGRKGEITQRIYMRRIATETIIARGYDRR